MVLADRRSGSDVRHTVSPESACRLRSSTLVPFALAKVGKLLAAGARGVVSPERGVEELGGEKVRPPVQADVVGVPRLA